MYVIRSMRLRNRPGRGRLWAALVTAVLMVTATFTGSAFAAGPGHGRVVSDVPDAKTPGANDGQVYAYAQVGGMMFAGGTFTSVSSPGKPAESRSYLIGFDANTGVLSTSFQPTLNGAVQALLPGPTSDTVYVAGNFNKANNVGASHLVLLDVNDGSIRTSFKAPVTNGVINSIARGDSRLFLGGNFTLAGGAAHGGLAAVNLTTGALDPSFNVNLTEHHNNTGSGSQGAVGAKAIEVNDQGDRLAVIGNFKRANGLSREQAVMVTLGAGSATVTPDWATSGYAPLCYSFGWDSYVRDVSFSPDGTFLVITATGGPNPGTLCDGVARFETYTKSTAVQPTWVDLTGGDTLYANTVTEQAVYIGGHNRWLNNPNGRDRAQAGAVPRPGIAALDPSTGLPLKWNPGRNPRGESVFVLYATRDGLWVGSDTDYFGDHRYKRPKIGFFPLADGAPKASDTQRGLPGDVYLAGKFGTGSTNTLADTHFGGGATSGPRSPLDSLGVSWGSVRGGFLLGDTLFYGYSDGNLYKRSNFKGDSVGNAVKIDPYHDPAWMNVRTGSGDGTYDSITSDFYGQINSVTGMFYANGRIYYTRSGNSNLMWRWFNADSGIVGPYINTASGGTNWSDTQGMFFADGKIYRAIGSTGKLMAYPLVGGVPTGPGTVVGAGVDWRARALFVGPDTAPPAPVENQAPTASFSSACPSLACTFDASGSKDSDGSVASYAWAFGDGTPGTGPTTSPTTSHDYAAGGSYQVTLTVTDDQGATGTATKTVNVTDAPPPPATGEVTFVGKDATSISGRTPTVTLPADVHAGDQLLLTGTYNTGTVGVTTPPGWTLLSNRSLSTTLSSYVWTKTASASDSSAKVTTSLSTVRKASLTALAYRGVDTSKPVAFASGTDTGTTSHVSPALATTAPRYVVESWQVRSAGNVSWTKPSEDTERVQTTGSGPGQTSALDADSGKVLGSGRMGGHTATSFTMAAASSVKGISWTFALAPAASGGVGGTTPATNQPPTASFTSD